MQITSTNTIRALDNSPLFLGLDDSGNVRAVAEYAHDAKYLFIRADGTLAAVATSPRVKLCELS